VAAEEMNFTRAAERLFISQQALSSHIKRLEEEYGVLLFERKPSLRLTLEGNQMLFYGRQLLAAEKTMCASFSDINQNCRGALKVGMSRLRGDIFFPAIWNAYHGTHTNISIEMMEGNSAYLDELLQAGKIDLYIGVDAPTLVHQERIELARERLHCCFTTQLLQQYFPDRWQEMLVRFQDGVDLRELAALPFITLRRQNRVRAGLETFLEHELPVRFVFEGDQQSLTYELSKSGSGVGLLSPIVFYQRTREIRGMGSSFHVFPIKNDIPENVVYLVYRKNYPLPHYGMDFIQVTRSVFQNYTHAMEQEFFFGAARSPQ
jgi:DNA-binding transcriptional LysR family regulator